MNPKNFGATSISIVPGTEFMSGLDEHVEYFIMKKIDGDQEWKDIKVILSNSQVAGEGEHKIMDFIRKQRGTNKIVIIFIFIFIKLD